MGSDLPAQSPVAVPGATGRRPWSTILLREWAQLKYPGERLVEQFKLGPTSAKVVGVDIHPGLAAALSVENWRADGIITLPHEVLIIEAKVKAVPFASAQVRFYQRQAFRTPELQPLMSLPFVPVLLFAELDQDVVDFCRQDGCRVEIYTPKWIEDYITQVQFQKRPSAPPGSVTTA